MKILVANWKENPETVEQAITLAKASDAKSVVICPPHLFVGAVGRILKNASLGGQDGFYEPTGPFTGEVSMAQLKASGATYVIVGHSQRRALGETDVIIAKKLAAALEVRLIPVLCIGETREERDAGRTKEVIDRQLRAAFSVIPADMQAPGGEVYITYEPVWAISTNQAPGLKPVSDTPAEAQTVIRYLEGIVRGLPVTARFLYGGSVTEDNLAAFLVCPEFAGALVGGASLRVGEFKKMIAIAEGL